MPRATFSILKNRQIPLDFDSEIYYNIYVYITIVERALFARWKAEKRE